MTKEKLEKAKAIDAKIEYTELCYSKMEINFPRTCYVPGKFMDEVKQDVIVYIQDALRQKIKELRAEFKALK